LRRRKLGIAGLRDSAAEHVEHTGVLTYACELLEPLVKLVWILTRELFHGMDTEEFEIPKHRFADALKVTQADCWLGHRNRFIAGVRSL
jgi:hypothetical protein